MSRLLLTLIGVVAVLLSVAGCGDSGVSAPSAGRKPVVVTTTTMIGDLVRRIGGEHVTLKVIMPAGVDPHTFKPSTSDLGELSKADQIFYNGLHLEGKMVDLFEEKLKSKSIAVAHTVPEERLLAWKEGQGGAHDPHIWFDVQLWTIAGRSVADGLAKLDPPHAAEFQTNYVKVEAEMKALDAEVRAKLAAIPKETRVLITSHDAYNYFGRAYDVEVRGLQGISTETEAGLAGINGAVDFIIQRKIPAIFVESSVSHKAIERVQADAKSRGFAVKIGGELYSDAMGVAGEHPPYAVETYDGMVRYNVDTIARALMGQVARGEDGKEATR